MWPVISHGADAFALVSGLVARLSPSFHRQMGCVPDFGYQAACAPGYFTFQYIFVSGLWMHGHARSACSGTVGR